MEKTKKVSKNTFKKKPEEAKSSSKSFDFGVGRWFSWNIQWSENHRKWLAFIVFLLSIFLGVSFVSFLYNALSEQSLYQQNLDTLATQSQNLGGAIGGIFAYIFVHNGFGYLSLLIPLWLMWLSVVIYFHKGWNRLTIGFLYMTFLLYFLSTSLGFFTLVLRWSSIEIAGSIGLTLAEWISLYIGNMGLGLVLLIIAAAFVSYHLQNQYTWAKKLFQWIPNVQTSEPSQPSANNPSTSNNSTQNSAPSEPTKKNDEDFIIAYKKDGVEHSKNEPETKEHEDTSNLKENNPSTDEENEDFTIEMEVNTKSHLENRKKGEISFEIEEGVKEMPVLALTQDEVFTNIAKTSDEEFVKVIPDSDQATLNEHEDVGDWER